MKLVRTEGNNFQSMQKATLGLVSTIMISTGAVALKDDLRLGLGLLGLGSVLIVIREVLKRYGLEV